MTASHITPPNPAQVKPISLTLASDPLAVRLALAQVDQGLTGLGLSEDICGSVQRVLAEAMNNIVEHAYGAGAGTIALHIQPRSNRLICHLTDAGRPMPPIGLPAGRAADPHTALQDLPEGGFGWLLIRAHTQDLSYQRRNGQNHLKFAIPT